MNRNLFVGFLMLVLISNLLHGCNREEATPKGREEVVPNGIVMQLTPSKTEYQLNEQIVISITLTNPGKQPCRMSGAPDGTMDILSITRDGTPIEPAISSGTYIDGFGTFFLANLVLVEASASVSQSIRTTPAPMRDGRLALITSLPDGGDQTKVMRWPVEKPGRYTLTARYSTPTVIDAPVDLCATSPDPVSTKFSVTANE